MLRSVKSQIVLATSLIIIVILGATAYLVIDQKIREINQDIFAKAVSFSELTHERVVTNYERNYVPKAFANFDRELAEIYSLNPDVTDVSIFNYNGETLYKSESQEALSLSGGDRERLQAVFPSVKVKKSGRVVYLEKAPNGASRFTNFNGRDVDPVSSAEQIEDVVYPFRDQNNATRAFSIRYQVSYDALADRVRETVINIGGAAILGILVALFVGGLMAGHITSPIKKLSEGAEKIGKGDLKTRIDVISKSEIGRLAGTFNQMATDLEKSTQVLVEKEKLTRELELAGEIQRELLPKELPKLKNLDIAASLSSATEVGGDCYDFLPSGDELLFYIADVTGHGVPAGLVAAINNALVPALMDHYKTPKELVDHLNVILKLKTRPNVFMTMVMASFNALSGKLSFTQAGHDPILHYQAKQKNIQTLATGGMALGMIADLSKLSKTEVVDVAAGDVLVLYTDGIPEAWKNEKDKYGMDALKESLQKHSQLRTAQEIHDGLLKDVRAYMGDYPQQDDITLIVVKRTA